MPESSNAQSYLSQKYKLARSFENSGDYINAARLYYELVEADSLNENYFYGYVRTMQAQNRNSELISFVEKFVKNKPLPEIYILLGEIYWKDGRTKQATKAWEKAVQLGKNSRTTYDKLAMTQISLRLFHKAIETYIEARENLDAPDLFADKLSQLYSISGDYKNGTKEVLKLLEQTHNLALAEGRISALNVNAEAEKYILDILKTKAENDDIEFMKLYAWYLTSLGKYKDALRINIEIDNSTNALGREVYNFSLSAADDAQYDIAIEGLQWIISKGRKSPYTISALFRLAKITEMKYSASGNFDVNTAEGIIKQYRKIIKDYPRTSTADECRYNIALLYKRLGQYDKALEELKYFDKLRQYSTFRPKAILMEGEIFFLKNDLNQAILSYRKIVDIYKRFTKEYYMALYSLAEIEYFEGEIDSALAHFTDLTLVPNSDVANDALEKISLIEAYKNLNMALAKFAQAEKNQKQKKLNAAIDLFLESARLAKPENLQDIAILKASQILIEMNNLNEAEKILSELSKEKPAGIHNDYCLFLLGKIFYLKKNNDKAIKTFTELLKKYPKSIYNERARDYINKIRTNIN